MEARTLMVQGTASSVGKSLMVAALCRIYRDRGLRSAPFKAQNMALNSAVTPDGRELGRAQAMQAEAAGIDPVVEMNPILLKPEPGMRSQVVIMGKPVGSMTYAEYHHLKPQLLATISGCLTELRAKYDVVVIEGAGSPAEINLNSRDIVNMEVARMADAPVILTGDIDRGGVFAQLVGTMELLEPGERARVAAFLINKFRGEVALLKPGLDFLEGRYKVPVLGVVPFIERLRIPDEDSVGLEHRRAHGPIASRGQLDIAVISPPSISNYDDFLPLEREPGVAVRYVDEAAQIRGADLVVLPGSKSAVSDLEWLSSRAFSTAIVERARRGWPVLGICGGCQMLGESIEDPHQVESRQPLVAGLGLLRLKTHFELTKLTARVRAEPLARSFLAADSAMGEITGYEIRMGRISVAPEVPALFRIIERNGRREEAFDGAVNKNGNVAGTMIHGLFENDHLRASLIASLCARRGLSMASSEAGMPSRESEYDRLAETVRQSIDLRLLDRIAGLV